MIAATAVLVVAVGGIFIGYKIFSPAREAASNLQAINSITVGQTTEADLLGRAAFQKIEESCSQGDCFYHMETENSLLNKLHLAPRTRMTTAVFVRDGLVTGVLVYTKKSGFPAISLRQVNEMPSGCTSDPCVRRLMPPSKALAEISIVFSSTSAMRNHIPEAVNADCFSRLHGCATPAEFLPVTKNLDLGTITSQVK